MKKVFEQPIVNLESLQASDAIMVEAEWDVFDFDAIVASNPTV